MVDSSPPSRSCCDPVRYTPLYRLGPLSAHSAASGLQTAMWPPIPVLAAALLDDRSEASGSEDRPKGTQLLQGAQRSKDSWVSRRGPPAPPYNTQEGRAMDGRHPRCPFYTKTLGSRQVRGLAQYPTDCETCGPYLRSVSQISPSIRYTWQNFLKVCQSPPRPLTFLWALAWRSRLVTHVAVEHRV